MLVKICGITHPEDAREAELAGADYIGIILSRPFKRFVELPVARKIVAAVSIPVVGVFVHERGPEIRELMSQIGFDIVQLHGAEAKKDAAEMTDLPCIVVDGQGAWVLSEQARSRPACDCWFIAGGLNGDNVVAAIEGCHPDGVDVSSGVCGADGLRKDRAKVEQFIREAKR